MVTVFAHSTPPDRLRTMPRVEVSTVLATR